MNTEGMATGKVLENKELADLVTALGCSVGKNYDAATLRYGKVIILADADSDGHHIATLLLTFLYRHMPQLMTAGKKAATEVNQELGLLEEHLAEPIVRAAQEVIDGKFDADFAIDIYQTGSGTSTNMNANEVIANRAIELIGGTRGSRMIHPNDHVNICQSSNDVIPTAIHVATLERIENHLLPALGTLHKALAAKAREFDEVMKIGRTHLMDATPIRLGQEFSGYARQVELGIRRVESTRTSSG